MKNHTLEIISLILIFPALLNCQHPGKLNKNSIEQNKMSENNKTQLATFAGGCFWCIEAAYDQLKGVSKVQSGYAGGHDTDPTYKEVCSGNTGHAEVVQISFDPEIISYDTLLEVFWTLHDPTQLNRQGNDIGTQYRSEIFYHNEAQKDAAEKSLTELKNSGLYSKPVVTAISALNNNFFPAEDYHTDYYELNKTQPYCSAVVAPKLAKFHKKFSHLMKEEYK